MAPIGSDALFYIKPCLVCGMFFEKKAMCVENCSYTYHPFCFVAHIDILKQKRCARHTCNEEFNSAMVESFGFQHHSIELLKSGKQTKPIEKDNIPTPSMPMVPTAKFLILFLTIARA